MENENLEIMENEDNETEVTDIAVCDENESKISGGTVAVGVGIIGLAGYGLYKLCRAGYSKAKAFIEKRKEAKYVNQNDYIDENVEE